MYAIIVGTTLSFAYRLSNEAPVTVPCNRQSDSQQQQPCAMELPEAAIRKLKVDAGFGWGIFSGSVYNGNENYHVTQLTVSMLPIHGHHHHGEPTTMPHDPKVH